MGGAVAALACKRYFHFRKVVPCHYASFGTVDQSADKFVAGMEGSGVEILLPEKGRAVEV
jgi:L-ascorbate metabolism protein UlaG (beta-lactamase superfamily)